MARMEMHRFETLDAVRGAAALLVLGHHLELRAGYGTHFLSHGYLAVDLFFMLSGFVIGYAYEQRLLSGMSFKDFAVARLIRLQPFILAGVVLGVLASALAGNAFDLWWLALLLQAAYLPWRGSGDEIYAFNGAQWSLLFEVAVNLFYGLTIRWMSTRVIMAIIALNAVGLFLVAWHWGSLGVGWGWSNALGAIPRTGFGFYTGVLLWRLWKSDSLPKVNAPWPVVLAATAAVIVVASVPDNWRFTDPVLVLLAMPPLVWLGACSQLTGRFASIGLLAGALSYPVYAIQGPVRLIIADTLGNPAVHSPAMILLMTVSVLVASWVLLKVYDEPVREWLRTATRKRRAAAA